MQRKEALESIRANPDVSVLIIGAGINGIGTFRDLALQGVDVLIVEKGDFCSGASAASSHMVHGGIRYLENGEFRLVREAVHERNRLVKNAPQYVRPLATNIPIFSRLSGLLNAPLKFFNLLDKPSERGAMIIKMGLMMYDAYTKEQGDRAVPPHEFIGREKALHKYPKLNPEIVSLATYYDAAMPSPERIALEVLFDGIQAHSGAHALNYVTAVGAEGDTVQLRDEISGETLSVKPQLVINAAGPWIDFANQNLGMDTNFIGGTKGSHIVVNHPELVEAVGDHEFFFENSDGRVVLIYPFFPGRVMIGTSDIKITDPEQARCTDDEIDYFLSFVKKIFPTINVTRNNIVYQFSGVRPLPSSDANTTGQISRDHSNRVVEPADSGFAFPIFNLIGGKWTTFRAFSEQAADAALERLGATRKVSTGEMAIGGGHNYPESESAQQQWVDSVAKETGVPAGRVRELFDRYGTGAQALAAYIAQGEDRPLTDGPTYSVREVKYLAENEMVVHLDDFLKRRSLLAMTGHLTRDLIVDAAAILGEALGWSDDERTAELDRTFGLLAREHSVVFEGASPKEEVYA